MADTVGAFARLHGVTQIFVRRQTKPTFTASLRRGLVQRIVGLAAR